MGALHRIRIALRPAVHRIRRWRAGIRDTLRPATPWDGVHHPAIEGYAAWSGVADGVHLYDFLGIRTDSKYRVQFRPPPAGPIVVELPRPSAQYLELVAILSGVRDAVARGRLSVMELGAGYGPWLVVAHRAATQLGIADVRLVGVEMVPRHFRWMREHLVDNGIDPQGHSLVNAAVAPDDGSATFRHERDPRLDFGQRVAHWRPGEEESVAGPPGSSDLIRVPAVSLKSLLRRHRPVDILHMDVQGAERKLLDDCSDEIAATVRRIIVATHSRRIHRSVVRSLLRTGWKIEFAYPCRSRRRTRFGDIQFLDGLVVAHRSAIV